MVSNDVERFIQGAVMIHFLYIAPIQVLQSLGLLTSFLFTSSIRGLGYCGALFDVAGSGPVGSVWHRHLLPHVSLALLSGPCASACVPVRVIVRLLMARAAY